MYQNIGGVDMTMYNQQQQGYGQSGPSYIDSQKRGFGQRLVMNTGIVYLAGKTKLHNFHQQNFRGKVFPCD